jgi:hypothetical protein
LDINDHLHYNCEVILDTGDKYKIDANWMHNQQLDNWQSWLCDAGHLRLHIDENLDVFSGECLNDKLGNVLTDFTPFTQPMPCKQTRCTGCTDDLIQHKRKI